MIISKTPLRISFVGGGSDLAAFYRTRPGAVVSCAINKFAYVTVNRRFDSTIRVSYTQTEIVNDMGELHHDLARECMRLTGVTSGIELTTIADVPAGTGLGSSSAVTVGILHALYGYKGVFVSAERLAREACAVEIDILKHPIGKQDQYVAAFGGLNLITFYPDESVTVEPVISPPGTQARLQSNLLLFYTGLRGDNRGLLGEQRRNVEECSDKRAALGRMADMAWTLRQTLAAGDADSVGSLLHDNWELKKTLAASISNENLERWYALGLQAGARGGKLLGAGSGGFLLFYCPVEKHGCLRAAMSAEGLREHSFAVEKQGSRIIYVGD